MTYGWVHNMTEQHNARTCANCACFARMKPDGSIVPGESEYQTVCRRHAPGARQVTIDVPVMKDGQPVLDGRQRPRIERVAAFQFGYQPTAPELVCFDGWRPIGTPPGETRATNPG
jgi:hypothetical protein